MGMLAWLHAVPRAHQGRLLLSVLAVVLIRPLRWAWECSDYSNDDVPGLAGGQHRANCAAVLGRLELQWELESMGCDVWMTPRRITPGWRRYISKYLPRPMLQQVHLEASVAVHEAMLEHLTARVNHPPSAFILFATCMCVKHWRQPFFQKKPWENNFL